MPRDARLYMTFPIDFHRHPKIARLSDAAFRWGFFAMVAERAAAGTRVIPCVWDEEIVSELERAQLITREPGGIALVENGLWGIARPYRQPINPETRAAIYERDGYRCRSCGASEPLQIDHIYPWSKGGTDEPSNLQTLCAPCNQSKGAKV